MKRNLIAYISFFVLIVLIGVLYVYINSTNNTLSENVDSIYSANNKAQNLPYSPIFTNSLNEESLTQKPNDNAAEKNNLVNLEKYKKKRVHDLLYENNNQSNSYYEEKHLTDTEQSEKTHIATQQKESIEEQDFEKISITKNPSDWAIKSLGKDVYNLLFGSATLHNAYNIDSPQIYSEQEKKKIKQYANDYVVVFNKYYYIQTKHKQIVRNSFSEQTKHLDFSERMKRYSPGIRKLANEYKKFASDFAKLNPPDSLKFAHERVQAIISEMPYVMETLAGSANEDEFVQNIDLYSLKVNQIVKNTLTVIDVVKNSGVTFDPGEPGAVLLFNPASAMQGM